MNKETDIQLSGPFGITDGMGQPWNIKAIRIFDEGYGIIDVYIDLATSMREQRLYDDPVVIRQILARLRTLGYAGPDFGHGDLGLQDDKLIVLEAPEAFNAFAASKGWKNLAEEFAEEHNDDCDDSDDLAADPASSTQLEALMRKFKAQGQ